MFVFFFRAYLISIKWKPFSFHQKGILFEHFQCGFFLSQGNFTGMLRLKQAGASFSYDSRNRCTSTTATDSSFNVHLRKKKCKISVIIYNISDNQVQLIIFLKNKIENTLYSKEIFSKYFLSLSLSCSNIE